MAFGQGNSTLRHQKSDRLGNRRVTLDQQVRMPQAATLVCPRGYAAAGRLFAFFSLHNDEAI